eukprot:403347755
MENIINQEQNNEVLQGQEIHQSIQQHNALKQVPNEENDQQPNEYLKQKLQKRQMKSQQNLLFTDMSVIPQHYKDKLKEEKSKPCGKIQDLPFEMFIFIAQYCAAQESFFMIRVNREFRSFMLGSKIIHYNNIFAAQNRDVISFNSTQVEQVKITKYFKIMENAGSKDLFVFYELLIWAIKAGNVEFVEDQIQNSFKAIILDCLKNKRTFDRFLAFFGPQEIEQVKKLFENLQTLYEENVTDFAISEDQQNTIFEYLLNKRRKYDGNSLVHLSIKFGQCEVLDYFFKNQEKWKIDLKSKNKDGYAPIHLTVKQKSLPMFNLVARNSDQLVMPVGSLYVYPTSVQINMYEDTITLAGQAGDAEIFKTLIYSVNTNVHTLNVKKAMLYACEYNHLDIVKFLVSMNFTLNQNLVMKKTPLYVACEKGHIELATYLIQRFEIDPNIQCEDSNKTALFVSAEKGFKDIVTELIRRPDIDVNKTTSGKKTALYVAIEKNQVECVRQILKKCRADDLYATTSFGTTPLFAAQKKGCKEIIRLMMCVGRTSNPDYEKTVPQVAEENKENIIISELPRFLQEVRAFYELFPSEFNGGLKPNNKNKVQSRYMEGVSNPKRANEEDEVHIHPQNTLRKTRSQSQAAFQIKQRPQTAKVTLKQPRLKESQVQSDNDSDSQDEYIQEDEYEDEEFKEGIKKCGQETTIKKKQSIKPQITKIRENSTLMKPLKKDIISNENKLIKAVTIVNQIGKIPKYLEKLKKTKTQEEKLEVVKEPTDSEYENPIMSKVKSRLFDYLQTNKQQQQDEEEKKAQEKLIVQKPVNIKRLGELSKPRRPLDIKECFVPQKNQKLIVYRDPNYLPPSILEKYDVSVDGVLMSQSLKEQKGELNIVNEKQKQSPHKDKRLKSGVRRNTTSTNFLNLQTKLFSINSKRSKKKQVQQNKSINQQNNSLNRLQNNRDIEGMIENKQPNQDLNFYQDLNDREPQLFYISKLTKQTRK